MFFLFLSLNHFQIIPLDFLSSILVWKVCFTYGRNYGMDFNFFSTFFASPFQSFFCSLFLYFYTPISMIFGWNLVNGSWWKRKEKGQLIFRLRKICYQLLKPLFFFSSRFEHRPLAQRGSIQLSQPHTIRHIIFFFWNFWRFPLSHFFCYLSLFLINLWVFHSFSQNYT